MSRGLGDVYKRQIKNSEVTEILTENKKVKGIKINNSKIINSDYVICNSDPPNVYNNLIKSKEDYDLSLIHI